MKRASIVCVSLVLAGCLAPNGEVDLATDRSALTSCWTFQRGAGTGSVADASIYRRYPTAAEGTAPNLWSGLTSSGPARALVRWDLATIPANSTVRSATATFYTSNAGSGRVRVHRITAPWVETTTTWSSFAERFDPHVVASFAVGGYGNRTVDLTALVKEWVTGETANNGVLLEEDGTTSRTGYGSSENASAARRPLLTICWEDPRPPAPPPPADAKTLRFAVFGDYGTLGAGLDGVSAMVRSWNVDAILTTGDNVYSSDPDPYDAIVGRTYHDFIGDYQGAFGAGSPTNRFWPTIGNHDMDIHLDAYLRFFTLPGNERYYETALDPDGAVRLLAFDSDRTEPDGGAAGSVQANWLRDRLAASRACFNVIAQHEPPFSSELGVGHSQRDDLQLPFRAWGADLLLAGHQHGYERLGVNGVPHVIVGTGGGGIWGDWAAVSPYSMYRYPVSPTGWGAVLLTIRVGGGTGEATVEFYPSGSTEPADRHTFTKYCP